MIPLETGNGRQMISLLAELSQALRCCQQEAVFCENVTFTQFFILDVVESKRKIRLSDLHDILSVEKSTTILGERRVKRR